MTQTDLLAWDASAVPAVIGIATVFKRYLPENWTRFIPLVTISLGIVYAMTYRPGCQLSAECMVAGVQVGIMATGVHSSFKSANEDAKASVVKV